MAALTFSLLFSFPVMKAQGPYTLPALPYAYNALEPAIDAQTMEIHHSKHHAAYVNNLNAAIKGTKNESRSLEILLLIAGRTKDAVRNNAGGHYNHTLFWNILGTGKPFNPNSEVGKAILKTWGSVDTLKDRMNKAAATRFGSGWAWLYVLPGNTLGVTSTPNQDNPIMDVSKDRGIPVLGIDVWEHAYYLKYQNKRGDYLSAIWNVINWEAVNKNYLEAIKNPFMKEIDMDAWTALNDYHKVMSQTFHPAEENDLKPIYSRSKELAEKAAALEASPLPVTLSNPKIKETLQLLTKESQALHTMIEKKKKEEDVKKALYALHDRFHEVMEACHHE